MEFLENLKETAFFSFTFLSGLKYGEKNKLEPMASQHLKVGYYRLARERHFNGLSLAGYGSPTLHAGWV